MTHSFDVLVVGGGIVGLTAALSMAQRNYTVAVLDAGELIADCSHPDSRVYAISPASEALFKMLDVWQLVDVNRLSPYRQMHVWDATNKAAIDFDCRQIAANHLGTILEENCLKQALLEQASQQPLITLFPNCPVDAIKEEIHGISVYSQQQNWKGQLIMIADGAHSPARHLLKVPLTSWSYNQNALVATVQTQKPHQSTAYQIFHPEGPLAFLPLANANQCSIVWSTKPADVERLMKMEDEAFNRALTKAFAEHLGDTKLISTRRQFPLHMRHVTQYSGSSWILLGDAAHTIHPLAGLGLNVGLADVRSWMDCLDRKGRLCSNKRLQAYQRERKHAVWQTILLMEGLKRLFGTSVAPISALRGLGLNACNQIAPLKRLLIEQACK